MTQMFNVFSQTDLPGFRVRSQDDVPGFDIDENGLPRRERPWSDGAPTRISTPQAVTPVDCATVGGTLGCMTPQGRKFAVGAPLSFPPRLGPEVDQSHYYSVPDGPSPAPREDLEQGIVNVPTPGPRDLVRPATSEGTLNEATPEAQYRLLLARRGLPYGTLINPVRSYLTKDQWANLIVVNVTQPVHELH